MSNYIFVTLRTDEDNLMGANGWGEYSAKDSINAYGAMVEESIIAAYPGTEVEVSTHGARNTISSDLNGIDDAVLSIIDGVWQGWQWLRK